VALVNEQQRMELRVHEILDAGEGTWVDFKLELGTDHTKVARQIAASANAARGAEVVWLVGVRGDGTVAGVGATEHADWWRQVQACFNEISPDLTDVVVARDEGRVLALFFTTNRAPYLIKTKDQRWEYEVPWRDGTRTRTARRHELLQILAPAATAPGIEVIDAFLKFEEARHGASSSDPALQVEALFHVFVDCDRRVSFAMHKQRLLASLPGLPDVKIPLRVSWQVEDAASISPSGDQILHNLHGTAHVEVPSEFWVRGFLSRRTNQELINQIRQQLQARLRMELNVVRSAAPVILEIDLAARPVRIDGRIVTFTWPGTLPDVT